MLNITVGLACTAADIKADQDRECIRYMDALNNFPVPHRQEMNDALHTLDVLDLQMAALVDLATV